MNDKDTRGSGKRIMVVEDHPLVREGLIRAISAQPDMRICAEASTVSEAWQKFPAAKPDAIIVDISLPGPSGMELIKDLHVRHPDLPVLVISMHDEELYAERALRAGARGYLEKSEPADKVVEALRAILLGEVCISSKISKQLLEIALNGRQKGVTADTPLVQLSDRELQIYDGIGRGLSTRELAQQLNISPKTVETYRAHIKRKLALSSNNELVHSAVRWGQAEAARKSSG